MTLLLLTLLTAGMLAAAGRSLLERSLPLVLGAVAGLAFALSETIDALGRLPLAVAAPTVALTFTAGAAVHAGIRDTSVPDLA